MCGVVAAARGILPGRSAGKAGPSGCRSVLPCTPGNEPGDDASLLAVKSPGTGCTSGGTGSGRLSSSARNGQLAIRRMTLRKLAWTANGHIGKAWHTSRTETGVCDLSAASNPRDARTAVTAAAGAPEADSSMVVRWSRSRSRSAGDNRVRAMWASSSTSGWLELVPVLLPDSGASSLASAASLIVKLDAQASRATSHARGQ